jgi:phage-related protein
LTAAAAITLRNAQVKANGAALDALSAHHKLADAQDAVKKSAGSSMDAIMKVAKVTKGQASAAADTFGGKLAALKAHLTDQVAMFGQKYGPALQLAGVAIMAAGTIFEAGGALMATGEGLALGPILLIVAAVAGLILIGVLLWKNWDTIWGAIKKTISVVWDWIKTNWPLLLAIILGPFTVAAYLIYKNFDKIKSLAADAVAFIVRQWNTLYAFFSGIVSSVGGVLSTLFDKAKSAAGTVVGAVETTWTTFETWITGLPGRLTHTFTGMFDGISGAFKAAINWVIGAWDSLHFTIGGWKVGAGPFSVTLPKVDIGMPTIPKLAQGGLVTTSGLIYAHAGEAITPLPRGRLGPVLHIEHATFADPVDVDVLTQHIASLSRSRAV